MASLILLTLTTITFGQTTPLPSIVNDYIAEFRNDFDVRANFRNNYRPLLANVVRLAFHYCVGDGGCDGCLDLSHPDNAGLELSVNYLDQKADAWLEAGLSKADLYALAGMVAANMALGDNGWESDLSNFEIGRNDCDPASVVDEEFPNAHEAPFQFFEENFGFTPRETTVIFGAHTLGQAQVGNSGFRNFWVQNPLELGNDFYQAINRNPWRQVRVGNNFQWDQRGLLALNADIALVRNINPAANGQELTCMGNFNQCGASATRNIVRQFATNQGEAQFQEEFKVVYAKMLRSAGQGFEQDLQLVCDVYDCNPQIETSLPDLTPVPESSTPDETAPVDDVESDEPESEQPQPDAGEATPAVVVDGESDEPEDQQPAEEDSAESSEDVAEEESEDPVPAPPVAFQRPPPPRGRGRGKGRGGRRGRGRLL